MTEPLAKAYDLLILDLDGVLYVADQPVPGAAEAMARVRAMGTRVAYATNNASRRPDEVAALLRSVGVPADPAEVVTSAQAAAALLAERLPAGSRVLVVGSAGLAGEVAEAGLEPVREAATGPAAVVQGYGPDVGWRALAEACVAIRAGALWMATNPDRTVPSPRGPLPGNGAMVAALVAALGREPDVYVGKPEPALFEQTARRYRAHRPLVVGDRLDTDIEGAHRAGMDSLLVLTGITGADELADAPPQQRPTYVSADLTGLFDGARRLAPDAQPPDAQPADAQPAGVATDPAGS